MLQVRGVSVAAVFADPAAPTRTRDLWQGPYRYDSWVLDWNERENVEAQVGPRPAGQATFRRPPCSWHLYAPRTTYWHRDRLPVATEEVMWFLFTISAPLTLPLAVTQGLSVILDPQRQLVPHLYAMRDLQERGEDGMGLALQGRALVVLGALITASRRGGEGTPQSPWCIGDAQPRPPGLGERLEAETLRSLAHPPSLDALAQRLGLSVSSLCHRFVQETGQTVMQRMRTIRIREARRLLAEPGASVKQTAHRVGFRTAFHFSSVFHRMTGLTPSDFLHRHQRSRRT